MVARVTIPAQRSALLSHGSRQHGSWRRLFGTAEPGGAGQARPCLWRWIELRRPPQPRPALRVDPDQERERAGGDRAHHFGDAQHGAGAGAGRQSWTPARRRSPARSAARWRRPTAWRATLLDWCLQGVPLGGDGPLRRHRSTRCRPNGGSRRRAGPDGSGTGEHDRSREMPRHFCPVSKPRVSPPTSSRRGRSNLDTALLR